MKIKTSNRILYLVSIYIILSLINLVSSFKCGMNELKINPLSLNKTKSEKKRKMDVEYTPIKIKADYTSFTKSGSITDSDLQKAKDLIDETISEFSKFVKVQHEDFNLTGNGDNIKKACGVNNIDSNYGTFLIDYDIVVFPSFNGNLSSSTLAAASFCIYDQETSQPYAGILYINPKLSFSKTNTDVYMKQVLLHEMTHILIFHPTLFQKLGMVKTVDSVSYIISSKALDKARQHFNCASLSGIPLEDQGSTGSVGGHWEARYMLGDYMISTDYVDSAISDITLALFEDSNFYQVNYYSGGLFKFGKNKGCSFFNEKCIVNGETSFPDEFCTNFDEESCSNTRANKGNCIITEYGYTIPSEYRYFSNSNYGGFFPADYCPVTNVDSNSKASNYYPKNCNYGDVSYGDYGEKLGESSFCFNSSLLPSSSNIEPEYHAICYEVECDNTNKRIVVHYGSSSINCPTSGGTLTPSGFKGYLICPKYIDICSSESGKLCNDMFECLDKQSKVDEDTYSYVPGQVDDESYDDPTSDDDDTDQVIRIYTNNYKYMKYNYDLTLLLLLMIFI